MSEDLQKEIKEIKKEVNKERITNIKNSSIRNLKINGKRLLTNAPFVIAVAVPLGISKVLLDDIPFIRTNEKRYKETITEINTNEELSYQEQYIQERNLYNKKIISITSKWLEQEDGSFYRTIKNFELEDKTIYDLIQDIKELPQVIEDKYKKPTEEIVETKKDITEEEKGQETTVVLKIYEKNNEYIYAKQNSKDNIYKTIEFLVLVFIAELSAVGYHSELNTDLKEYINKVNKKYPKIYNNKLHKELNAKQEELEKVKVKK